MFCWSTSPVYVAAFEAHGGILIDQRCLSQQPEGKHCHASCQSCICCLSYSQVIYYLVDTHLFTAAQQITLFPFCWKEYSKFEIGLHILDNGTTYPQRSWQTKTTMPVKDRVGHTYMTGDYLLELWLFFEEWVLKMVQNNPVKCTSEPVSAECSLSLRRGSTGRKKRQIMQSYHTLDTYYSCRHHFFFTFQRL